MDPVFCGTIGLSSFFPGQRSRSRLIVLIQEPFRDDVIRPPLEMEGPELQGAEEWSSASLEGREGVVRSWARHPLADADGSWSRTEVPPIPWSFGHPPKG